MTTADILYQKAQTMPEELQSQVLDYMEYLWQKWQKPVKSNLLEKDKLATDKILTQDKKLTVDEMLQKMTIKTDKHATVEQMNESIAKAFENWQG